MPAGEGKPEAKLAAALIIIALAPAARILPLALILHIPAIGALLYLWYRRQYLLATVAMIITLVITGIWLGLSYSAFLLCSFALPATGLAVMRQHGRSLRVSVLTALLFPAAGLAATYTTWHETVMLFTNEMKVWAAGPEVAQYQGLAHSNVLASRIGWMADAFAMTFPSLLLIFVATLIFCGALMGYWLSRDAGIYRTPPLRFVLWKMPEWTLLPLAAAVVLLLFEQPLLTVIGWNALVLLFVVYSVCGLSLLEFYLRRHRLKRSLKAVVYVGLFLTQIVGAVMLPLAALFDAHFDFRRVRAKRIG